jgi:hypothetical protein
MNLLPEISIMFACGLGALLYYLFEYLGKKKMADFSITVWIKENWLKILILSPLCLLAYIKFIDTAITEQSAFLVGLSVSSIIDRLEDMAMKPKA